ncbi:tetratricopeptide repeat protein [Amphritea sp. HPY]|uniref:tetratricopeptide repeat protein n=1 Tax=Amphritea sp. HPY TaxID=3421652 RepID=UPI003D7D68B9
MISHSLTCNKATRFSILTSFCVLLAGCAANQPSSSVSQQQSELYEGKAILSHLAEQQAKTPEEALAKARQAHQSGDMDRALFQFIRAYELDDQNSVALVSIAEIHYQRRNYQTSYLAYQKALAVNPEQADAHTGSGMILLHRKQYTLAQESFNRAIELYLKQQQAGQPLVEAYTGLGIIHDIYGRYEQARLNYTAATSIAPDSPVVLNNLGYSFYMQEKWPEAENTFARALQADNQYQPAWKNLGLTYARQEKYVAALDALEQVMNSSQAYNDIGYICMISQRYNRAAYFFRKAISESPQYYKTAQQNLTRVKRLLASNPDGKSSL